MWNIFFLNLFCGFIFYFGVLSLKLSLFSFIKLIFIILLFIVNIILIYLNYLTRNEKSRECMQSGIIDSKFLKQIGTIFVGGVGLIASYKTITEDNKVNYKAIDMIEAKNIEIQKNNLIMDNLKVSFAALTGRYKEVFNENVKRNQNIERIDGNIIKMKSRLCEKLTDEKEKSQLIKEIEYLLKRKEYEKSEKDKAVDNFNKIMKEMDEKFSDNNNKNNLISLNIFELFDSFDPLDKIAISLLILSQVIMSALISIVFIFYGDFLIKKFDLEIKYPRLAKFIQLRRKFQQYYLLFSILCIVSVLLIETFFFIAILIR
jgi:hypothetical protein